MITTVALYLMCADIRETSKRRRHKALAGKKIKRTILFASYITISARIVNDKLDGKFQREL